MATPGNMPNYQYEKLQDGYIRLLRLRPGPRSGTPAIAEISSCLLEESTEYEALSYVWDKPLRTRIIACGEESQIHVPRNAFQALEWLQQEASERLLWIDAVCINQSQEKDAIEEREAQVKMMGKIYSKAKTVFMHFGANAFKYDAKMIGPVLSWLHDDGTSSACIPLFVKMWREEYFRRIWTIQETILAKEAFILFKDYLLSWSQLVSKMSKTKNPFYNIYFRHIPVVAVRELLDKDCNPRLLDLIWATATSKATDLRDKIYALFRLISGVSENYPVKYGPWTTTKVLTYYTFLFCQESKSLDVLETSRHTAATSIEQLPSWAIDFTQSPRLRSKAVDFKPTFWYSNSSAWDKTRFCAHGRLPLSIQFNPEQYLAIDTQGRKVGEITCMSPSNVQSFFRDFANHFERFTDISDPFAEWNSVTNFLVAFICTQCCDPGDPESEIQRVVRDDVKKFKIESGEDFESLKRRLIDHFTADYSAYRYFIQDIRKCCKRNSLFITNNLLMGLGSRFARPGDIVCVLNGARMPFILRRTNTTKKEYEVVCECYVYGIMQGEWMRDFKEDDLEWFRLV